MGFNHLLAGVFSLASIVAAQEAAYAQCMFSNTTFSNHI
jgi:hypothetical protein